MVEVKAVVGKWLSLNDSTKEETKETFERAKSSHKETAEMG